MNLKGAGAELSTALTCPAGALKAVEYFMTRPFTYDRNTFLFIAIPFLPTGSRFFFFVALCSYSIDCAAGG